MVQYMGPTTSMAHIIQKLAVIFSTMVSFDVQMQNFYEVTQGNQEKVPSFAKGQKGPSTKLDCSALEGWQS